MTYAVEIRDVAQRQFACECPDFRSNGLGTCKHVEAVLQLLEARHRRLFQQAVRNGSDRVDVVPDTGGDTVRVERGLDRLPARLRKLFDDTGLLRDDAPETALELLRQVAARKLKMARALGAEDLREETRDALLAAIHAGSRALAVEHHLSDPIEPKDAVVPPLALHWGEALPALRSFMNDPGHDWKPVVELLATR